LQKLIFNDEGKVNMKLYKKVVTLCLLFWAGFVVGVEDRGEEQDAALMSEITTKLKILDIAAIMKVKVDISNTEKFGNVTEKRVDKMTNDLAKKNGQLPPYHMTKKFIVFTKSNPALACDSGCSCQGESFHNRS
jgi:hypothetical protein